MPQAAEKMTPEQLTRWMSGMSRREWERWIETGGWMPDLMEIARCRIEAAAKAKKLERQMIIEARRVRKNANQRAARLRRKFKAASEHSPAWKPLPRKSAG